MLGSAKQQPLIPPSDACRPHLLEAQRETSCDALPVWSHETESQPGFSLLSCVDVLIAAWNSEATISRAIGSVLADEAVRSVIVIDDASTDQTYQRALAAQKGDSRVIVHKFDRNQGPAAARNYGLALSKAPWVAVVDADDYVFPTRFTDLLRFRDGWDFIADDLFQVDGDFPARMPPTPMLGKTHFSPWRCDFETFVLGNVSKRGRNRKELGFFKPLIRRSFLDQWQIRYDERLRLGEDYALYAKALACGARFVIVPAQGYVSVIRRTSLSSHHSKQDLENLRDSDTGLKHERQFSKPEMQAIRTHENSIDAKIQWLEAIEAVKARNVKRFTRAFLKSKQSATFISGSLVREFFRRAINLISLRKNYVRKKRALFTRR